MAKCTLFSTQAMKLRAIIFLCLIAFSLQRSTPEDNSYVAAVVAYELQSNSATNLQNYMKIIGDAAEQNADIIVFPELTISSRESVVVPINGLLKEHPIPALHPELFDKVLGSISSAARHHQIYVVINVQEFLNCTVEATGENCPEKKNYVFNTNVVFDRAGAVIDRYRKINLYGEVNRTATFIPDLGIFTTDFGVTFGHFICFDIIYQVPAVQVVQKYNIADVILTTKWYSEMPYLTAVQIQEAYAYAMNVNFLAAGANNVPVGTAGSGIYSGKTGALVSIMPGTSTTKLLVSRVPKVPGQVEGDYLGPINDDPLALDSLVLLIDSSLPSYVTRLIKPGLEEFTLIDKDVVCRFKIRMSERNSIKKYTYRAGAFSGVRSYSGIATAGTRVCSVFACTGNTIDTCGQRFPRFASNTTAVFEELTITATVPTPKQNTDLSANSSIYFPLSLDKTIKPLKPEYFNFNSVSFYDTLSIYTLELVKSAPDLYSFAIWGREYTTDDEEVSPPREHDEETDDSTTTPAPGDDAPDSSVIHKSSLILLVMSMATFFTFVLL